MGAWDRVWQHEVSASRRFGADYLGWWIHGIGFFNGVFLYGLAFDGSIGFGGMGCRSFDDRVGCHEFAMGVGCFFAWA